MMSIVLCAGFFSKTGDNEVPRDSRGTFIPSRLREEIVARQLKGEIHGIGI